jgi:hypothetical protein
MGKYRPLTEFLRKQPGDRVPMTFAEVERVLGFKLPRSAREHRAWWSNNPNNSVITKAWLDAGFQSARVDLQKRTLVFQKHARAESSVERDADRGRAAVSKRHSLYGFMKGTVKIAPGVDLTEPADPEWGEVAYGNRSWGEPK